MAIKNYTSVVPPSRSISKMQELLGENGAKQVSVEYGGDGKPSALCFKMHVGQLLMSFRLTVDVAALLAAMRSDPKVPSGSCTTKQAERTAWKNRYEWLALQMAEIRSGQARLEQLLLGYAEVNEGETLFEAMLNNEQLITD